jgi:hypothetical protein
MTDPSLANAWAVEMSSYASRAAWVGVLSLATVYAGAMTAVVTRHALARRRYRGGCGV